LICTVIRMSARWSRVWFQAPAKFFSPQKALKLVPEVISPGVKQLGVHLMLKLRMSGAIPLLPHTCLRRVPRNSFLCHKTKTLTELSAMDQEGATFAIKLNTD
jgi:hypothetical protein